MSINLTIIFYVLIVVAMIAFILVQKSSGATAGSAFGGGASSTVFGAKGSGNFLTKTTMFLAFLFFAISMMMAVQAKKEFSAVNSGEVDLGVIGTLESENSDMPTMAPTEPVVDDADIPQLGSGSLEEPMKAIDNVEQNVNESVDAMKSNVENAVDGIKQEVTGKAAEKAEELKTDLKEKIDDPKQ